MKRTKKLIAAFLAVLMLALTIMTLFTGCGTAKTEANQRKAEECAKKEAEKYYANYFKGKTLSGVKYSNCTTKIKSTDYKNGKYVVTVGISADVSGGGYSLTLPLMDITYTVSVKGGVAKIEKTKYDNI